MCYFTLRKKLFILSLVMCLCTGFRALATDFVENFDGFAAGTPNSGAAGVDISGSLDTYTTQPGWSGNKVFQAGGAIKMGTSSTPGYMQTPAIDLSPEGGNFTISFKSMAWSGDATVLGVYLDGQLVKTIDNLPNTAAYTFSSYTFQLTGGTASSVIKFAPTESTSKKRFFLDDLTITQTSGPILDVDASLSDLKINGSIISGFQANKLTYKYRMDTNSTVVPSLTATTSSSAATYVIENAASLPGASKVTVTAENTDYTREYVVNFVLMDNDGSDERPFTIDEAKEFQNEGSFWVQGTIIGRIDYRDGSITQADTINTNIALGDSPDNYLAVQLPQGAVREAINLKDNPTLLNTRVKVFGNLTMYCTIDGVKNTSDYEILDDSSTGGLLTESTIFYTDGNRICITNLREPSSVYIYDSTGKLLFTKRSGLSNEAIPVVQKGLYIVRLVSNTNTMTQKVLVK